MKYPPKHHQDNNKGHLIEVIKSYPLATVISVKDNLPLVSHLPLVYDDGKLIGHIDIFNPQKDLLKDGNLVTIIFQGPQCYISPKVYSTTQLPTCNFIKVHLRGTVEVIKSKAALKQSLIAMTEFLEAPNHDYVLEPDNPRLDANLEYIEMFEVNITEWEGKLKLSQDKKTSDMMAARKELIRANQVSIADFLDKVF